MSNFRWITHLLVTLMLVSLWAADAWGLQSWTSFQNGGWPSCEAEMPTTWSPEQGLKWQVDLAGYGQSTPVIHGQQIYVTSVSGKQKENLHIQALSMETGEEIWRYEAANSTPQENNPYVSRAAPTPVCDDEGLIAFFEGGNLMALTHDGKLRWALDLTQEYGDVQARHGLAASLEQNEQHVFVWVEREKDPYVLALKKQDGEAVWKSPGLGGTSWASPRLVPVGDANHLVLSGSGKLAGLDPDTGKRLWDFDQIGGNSTPTPVPVGAGRFLMGASPGRSEAEGDQAAKSNGMIQISNADNAFQAKWLWQAERATSSFGSPIVHDGKAYFVNRQGVVFCLNAEDGQEIYVGRSPAGSVWATPLALGQHIYLFGKDGVTVILANAEEMQEVATNDLWTRQTETAPTEGQAGEAAGNFGGPVLYAATPHTGGLLLRRGDVLYCVSK